MRPGARERRLRAALWLCCGALAACGGDGPAAPEPPGLRLLSSHRLEVAEPSGLSFGGASLWTVSGRNQRVYRLDLEGRVHRRLDYKGEDLEGIAYDPSDASLWVVEEGERAVVHLNGDGREIGRRELDLEGPANSGLEGVCLEDGVLHLLNEKDPPLYLALGDGAIRVRRRVAFASDLAGLACGGGRFWLLSDRDRALYLWGPERGVEATYPLDIDKAEGVALDPGAGRLYVVSESESRLYVYLVEDEAGGS